MPAGREKRIKGRGGSKKKKVTREKRNKNAFVSISGESAKERYARKTILYRNTCNRGGVTKKERKGVQKDLRKSRLEQNDEEDVNWE